MSFIPKGDSRAFSVAELAKIVAEASVSQDPDVITALENLQDVILRSQVRRRIKNNPKPE